MSQNTDAIVPWASEDDTSGEDARRIVRWDSDGAWDSDEASQAKPRRSKIENSAEWLYGEATTPREAWLCRVAQGCRLVHVLSKPSRERLFDALPLEWRFAIDYFHRMRTTMSVEAQRASID